MTLRSVYIMLLPISLLSYCLLLIATFSPNYMNIYSLDNEGYFSRHDYGLYHQCYYEEIKNSNPMDSLRSNFIINTHWKSKCQRFPEPTSSLCHKQHGFCTLWELVGSFNILAVFIGLFIFIMFLNILKGASNFRAIGWLLLAIFITIYVLAKGFLLAIIHHVIDQLRDDSIRWYKVRFGFCYHLTLISALFDLSILVTLLFTHLTLRYSFTLFSPLSAFSDLN